MTKFVRLNLFKLNNESKAIANGYQTFTKSLIKFLIE